MKAWRDFRYPQNMLKSKYVQKYSKILLKNLRSFSLINPWNIMTNFGEHCVTVQPIALGRTPTHNAVKCPFSSIWVFALERSSRIPMTCWLERYSVIITGTQHLWCHNVIVERISFCASFAINNWQFSLQQTWRASYDWCFTPTWKWVIKKIQFSTIQQDILK